MMRALSAVNLAAVAMAIAPASANAEARLEGLGPTQVRELSHAIYVDVQGGLADVEHRMVFANPGRSGGSAVYTFDLPAGAAIYDLSVRAGDGVVTRSAVVSDQSAQVPIVGARSARGTPDRGFLRLVEADTSGGPSAQKTYELYASPLWAEQQIEVRLRWRAAMTYASGRHSLRIPHRGSAQNLVREDVTLEVKGAHNAVFGGGKLLGKGGRHTFTAPSHGDLVIEASPVVGSRPSARSAVWPLGKGRGVVALRLIAPPRPPQKPTRPDYLLLVADVSRSLGRAGQDAARRVADDLMTSAGDEVPVELITFDLTAKRLFGDFVKANRDTRLAVSRALEPKRQGNGSNLGAALELANKALRKRVGDGLIVVITDSLLPLSLAADDAITRLAPARSHRVASVVLVPDSAPFPDTSGPLLELAAETDGAVIALRHRDATQRGPTLLADFGAAPPLVHMEASAPQASLYGLNLPVRIEAGSGITAFGFYQGKAPRMITVRGHHGAREVALKAGPMPRAQARSLAQLAVASAGPGELGSAASDADEAEVQLVQAAADLHVIGQGSALVAVDSSDGYARDRLAMADKWGAHAYHRFPRPEERGHRFREFEFSERTEAQRALAARQTGELDRAILRRLFTQYVKPRARRCYDRELRGDRSASGSMLLEVEIARGEVQSARVEESSVGVKGIEDCVVEAAYAIQVPSVAQGGNLEAISLARYPIRFRFKSGRARVDAGPPRAPGDAVESEQGDDPLEKLPD